MNVLIVKLGSIGDIVHALPALAALRNAEPEARIGWVAEKRSAEILRGNRLLDVLIEVDTRSLRGGRLLKGGLRSAGSQFRELRTQGFDVAVDMQGLLKSAAIAKISGASSRWGFERGHLREPASRIFLTNTASIPSGIHVIRKNLKLISEALDIPVPYNGFQFPIFSEQEHRDEAAKIAETIKERFGVLNPAGGWPTKLWQAEKFGALADMLWERKGLASVITYGPGEQGLANAAAAASRSQHVLTAGPSLKGFFELVKRAAIYVGGDTGPTHLAVAAGVPVVGIFGPTEWWRNGSPSPDDICVERNDIGCRIDCHRRSCSNWICMDINVQTVYVAVEERLKIADYSHAGI